MLGLLLPTPLNPAKTKADRKTYHKAEYAKCKKEDLRVEIPAIHYRTSEGELVIA
jgi:hypothetical protein